MDAAAAAAEDAARQARAARDAAGVAAEDAARQARAARDAAGVAKLQAEIARRETAGEKPLVVSKAVALLQAMEFTRKAARALVHAGDEIHWRLQPLDGEKGNPIALLPLVERAGQRTGQGGSRAAGTAGNCADTPPPPGSGEGGANGANRETPAAEGLQGGLFTPSAPGADGANPSPESPRAAWASDEGGLRPDLHRAGEPSGDATAGGQGCGQRCPKCGSSQWTPAAAARPGQCLYCGPVVGIEGGPDADADLDAAPAPEPEPPAESDQPSDTARASLTPDERSRLDAKAAAGGPLARRILGRPPTTGREPGEES
jgi:hypothetical protein